MNKEAYDIAKSAKVGDTISWPACGKKNRKRSYQHKFCNTKCKDHYWNGQPDRLERSVCLGYVLPKEVVTKTEKSISGIEKLLRNKDHLGATQIDQDGDLDYDD